MSQASSLSDMHAMHAMLDALSYGVYLPAYVVCVTMKYAAAGASMPSSRNNIYTFVVTSIGLYLLAGSFLIY